MERWRTSRFKPMSRQAHLEFPLCIRNPLAWNQIHGDKSSKCKQIAAMIMKRDVGYISDVYDIGCYCYCYFLKSCIVNTWWDFVLSDSLLDASAQFLHRIWRLLLGDDSTDMENLKVSLSVLTSTWCVTHGHSCRSFSLSFQTGQKLLKATYQSPKVEDTRHYLKSVKPFTCLSWGFLGCMKTFSVGIVLYPNGMGLKRLVFIGLNRAQ